MTDLQPHALAMLFPLIEGAAFDEFCDALKADGRLHEKIVLLDGQILDGRNRQRACDVTGVIAHYRTFDPAVEGEPLQFVIAKNLHRRHLTDDQRRMVAARLANLGPGRPSDLIPPNGRNIPTAEAAETLAVDVRGTERAKEIISKGTEEVQRAVDEGSMTVRTAADLVKLTPDEQREVIKRADPKIIQEVARSIRGGDVNGARAIMGSRVEPPDSLDFFPTPPWATRALVEKVLPHLGTTLAGVAWDPAAGEGHIVEVLAEYAATRASDIHDYGAGYALANFVDLKVNHAPVDWIITNPPFGDMTEKFVLRAFDIAKEGVAMFVRLQWLETIGRYEAIFAKNPPSIIAFFAERVNLCKGRWEPDGSTATAYIWLVWAQGIEPQAPFWIPPGQRHALERPSDRERFTAHPVAKVERKNLIAVNVGEDPAGNTIIYDPKTGEVFEPGDDKKSAPVDPATDGAANNNGTEGSSDRNTGGDHEVVQHTYAAVTPELAGAPVTPAAPALSDSEREPHVSHADPGVKVGQVPDLVGGQDKTTATTGAGAADDAQALEPDDLTVPAFLLRVELTKRERTLLDRCSLEECDRDEQEFIQSLRKNSGDVTAANRDRLLAIVAAQGLTTEQQL